MRKVIDTLYLMALGIGLGMVLALGALVAPAIFHIDAIAGVSIDHYQMGLVMSHIFQKSAYWLNGLAIMIVLREGYAYKSFWRDPVALPAAATAVLMIFLFTLYYTKAIVEYQRLGRSVVEDPKFLALHKGSEIAFGLLALSLALLLGRRLYLCLKGRPVG